MDECSLNENQELELKNYIENKGAIFISTPFSRAAADRLAKFNVPAFKIGSGECNNYPLIEHICQFKKPIILSTGMNRIEDIKISVEILRNHKIDYALLHTTNIYPTQHHLVRLDAMKELQKEFDDAVIGLSDHTVDNLSCLGAVALGASILERHFTDDLNREGPDIKNSMDPKQTKELIDGSKILFQARGGKKGPVNEEKDVINFAFSSVVTIKKIKKGDKLTKDNIWVKRPGTGPLFAKDFKNIINKIANKDIDTDVHLKPEDFE
jgi:N-acetylneuraminate synthase